jgi:flagellar hook-associated protein 2
LQSLASKLQALESAAEAMSDQDALAHFGVTSKDEDVVRVLSDGVARPGSYSIEVTSVATQDRNYSASFATGAVGLSDGDVLEITIDGETTSVAFDADDALADVAAKINSSGVAAWATVVGDGEGGGRLLVASAETGESQRITFGGSATAVLSMTNSQLAADATVVVDGVVTARSASNQIEGVLEGLTIDVVDVGTTTIEVEVDSDAIKEKVSAFVDAYNEVVRAIDAEFEWSGSARSSANLSGDVTLRSIQRSLRELTTSAIDGLSGEYTTLASIGITSERSGVLSIDDEELDSALQSDPQAVKDIFARNTDKGTVGMAHRLVEPQGGAEFSLIETIIDSDVGSLSARIEGIDDRTAALDESIERMEIRLTSYEQRLRNQFLAMEQMLSTLQTQSNYLLGLSSK